MIAYTSREIKCKCLSFNGGTVKNKDLLSMNTWIGWEQYIYMRGICVHMLLFWISGMNLENNDQSYTSSKQTHVQIVAQSSPTAL